MRSAVKI